MKVPNFWGGHEEVKKKPPTPLIWEVIINIGIK